MSKNIKKYISIILVVCLVMVTVALAACKGDEEDPQNSTPQETTTEANAPDTTTPEATTPETTTPEGPTETVTVTFPSDEEVDPKQEDVFFE